MTPFSSRLAAVVFGAGLFLSASSSAVIAQEPEQPQGQTEGGRAFDGYFATGLIGGLLIFIVAKTARR